MKRFFYVFATTALLTAVTVSCNKNKVTGVKLDQTTLLIVRGETATLTATVLPDEAENKNVTWTSSNKEVATVDNNGVITAIKVGTAVITVTTEEESQKASCTVTVLHPAEPEPQMVLVEGGEFTMGCTGEDCEADESPAHKVTLSSFKIAKYLVTREQWAMIMDGRKPSFHYHDDNLPVEQVSYNEVLDFIRRLNDSTGRIYRLPTEAEWEFAARGGNKSKGYKYSGSNDLNEVAWYDLNSRDQTRPFPEPQTWAIRGKKPNELGIYDMSGNVFEWCSDWYDPNYYASSPSNNPQGPNELGKSERITRGGCYNAVASQCRVSYRGNIYSPPQTPAKLKTIGFRLVLVP